MGVVEEAELEDDDDGIMVTSGLLCTDPLASHPEEAGLQVFRVGKRKKTKAKANPWLSNQ